MGYFKLTKQDIIFDAVKDPVWVRQNGRGRIVRCEVKEATGVLASDENTIYHIAGTKQFVDFECDEIYVTDITESEYTELSAIMDLGGTITEAEILWNEPQNEIVEPLVDDDLEEVKERYLSKLSNDCQTAIIKGFDATLSDGKVRHFDLELEDQINLMTLSPLVSQGENQIPYHASGCLCEYFSAEDFLYIVANANAHKTYHTTYFNSLKNWVMSMSKIADVVSVQYGDRIPEEYCSDVFLRLEGVKNA